MLVSLDEDGSVEIDDIPLAQLSNLPMLAAKKKVPTLAGLSKKYTWYILYSYSLQSTSGVFQEQDDTEIYS